MDSHFVVLLDLDKFKIDEGIIDLVFDFKRKLLYDFQLFNDMCAFCVWRKITSPLGKYTYDSSVFNFEGGF